MSDRIVLKKDNLEKAASEGVISFEQAARLFEFLKADMPAKTSFNSLNIAYYFGAFLVISAMTWFMTLKWEDLGGLGIFMVSLLYALSFILAGKHLWFDRKMETGGGILFTLAVFMVPLMIYGIEKYTGFWVQGGVENYRQYHQYINGSWILMEIGTILAGLIIIKFVRFPFLSFLVAFSLWYMSMDLTPLFFGSNSWENKRLMSIIVGLIILIIAYIIDCKTGRDFAFWGYLFGLTAFWGGLSIIQSSSEIKKFMYCMINLLLIVISAWLERRVFIVFGSLGVFSYLGYLSYNVFKNSMLFPFVLSFIGIMIIFLAVKYQKNQDRINEQILRVMPGFLRELRPSNRRYR